MMDSLIDPVPNFEPPSVEQSRNLGLAHRRTGYIRKAFKRFFSPGSYLCGCGRRISRNKNECLGCSQKPKEVLEQA